MFYNYLIFNMVTLSLRILLKYCVSTFKTNYVKESSQMFLASVSYNFSFGRKFKTGQRRVNNSDNDSGVMSTGK